MTEIVAKKKKKNKTEKEIERKTRIKTKLKRNRIFVAIVNSLLFVICLYSIYQSFTTESSELTISDIKWRSSTIIKLLISLLGYIGAILGNKTVLIVTTAFVLIDILLAIGMYSNSYVKLESQYKQYLQSFGDIDRSGESDDSDCDFIKVFRQTIVENLILISFYVFYVDSILSLIHYKESSHNKLVSVKPHPKWALLVTSLFHLFYSFFLFWSKTLRSDQREEILEKKGFFYILFWTSLAFLSIFIAIVSPFALFQFKFEDKFFLNFFISSVILSTILGSAQFLLIVANEFLGESPTPDYYCNVKLTAVDNLGSIFILLIINKISVSLILTLSNEIRKELKDKKDLDSHY